MIQTYLNAFIATLGALSALLCFCIGVGSICVFVYAVITLLRPVPPITEHHLHIGEGEDVEAEGQQGFGRFGRD